MTEDKTIVEKTILLISKIKLQMIFHRFLLLDLTSTKYFIVPVNTMNTTGSSTKMLLVDMDFFQGGGINIIWIK